MFNFFAQENSRQGDVFSLSGRDYNHIKNVLRMKLGDTFLVSHAGQSHLCELLELGADTAFAKIIEDNVQNTELPIEIYLFQGLPKSDKLEWILQKSAELGVQGVLPVETKRSIVKIEPKKKAAKQSRWQAIAESAAKQSKRNGIPQVFEPLSFWEAVKKAGEMDLILVPYENKEGMAATKTALSQVKAGMQVGIFIGPEGGFEEGEIEMLQEANAHIISLGKRILRTETAAVTAVSMVMLYAETEIGNETTAQ